MTDELREFVYLNSMAVNSLLASQQVAIPETVRDVSESVYETTSEGSIGGGFDVWGVGNISGELSMGDSDQTSQLAETQNRINDQYRFSILHSSLEQETKLVDLNQEQADDDESFSYGQGDVIKAEGECVTDPFYRVLSSILSLMRISKIEQIEEGHSEDFEEMTDSEGNWIFETWREILHGERIGLRIDSEDFRYPVVMSIDTADLWVNPERSFIHGRKYTVVGRVSRVLAGNSKWDFVDLLQIMGQTFSDESLDQFRDVFAEVGESLAQASNDGDYSFNVNIGRDDYVVEAPAIVVEPVAIYW